MRFTPKKNRSLEERLTTASLEVESALEVFNVLADHLEGAADTASEVVEEAEAEVLRLRNVRDTAFRRQAEYHAKADKLRELFQ